VATGGNDIETHRIVSFFSNKGFFVRSGPKKPKKDKSMATFDVAVEIKDRPDRADGFVTTKVGDIVAICPHPHTWTAMEEMSLIILVVTGVEWDDMEVFQSPSNVDGEALTDMDTEKPFTMKRLYQIPVDRVYELYPDFDMAAALDSSVRYQPWLDGDYEPLNIKSVNRVVRNKHLNAWVNI
jgi:hypothetical protein